MFANERQNKIYEMLQSDGAVTATRLVELFGVSVETVRRDLLVMEQDGRLVRVHGGAVAKNDMKPYYELRRRNREFEKEKYELSQRAAKFISNGDVIGVDTGSTAAIFAKMLKENFSEMTVITHSVDVFETLRNYKNFSVILCGGYYMREENAFYGSLALDMLGSLHIGKAFIFPTSLSVRYGIFDYQKELLPMTKKLAEISDEVYILADSSKFEKTGLLKMSDVKREYTYITDSGLQDSFLDIYRENGLRIYTGGKNDD